MHADRPAARPLPARLVVAVYSDALVEAHGHRPEDRYVEEVWLPVLGPSTVLLWRRLTRLLADAGSAPLVIDVAETTAVLGLGSGTGRHAVGARTFSRLVGFEVASWAGDTLAVRAALPDCPPRHIHRLPGCSLAYHQAATAGVAGPRFGLGRLAATAEAVQFLAASGLDPAAVVSRHHRGDWGDTTVEESLANSEALQGGGELRSRYQLPEGTLTVTTDPGRTTTRLALEA